MENAAEFDLNAALNSWIAGLGQSPQVKAEDLCELETHVRDSVGQLQMKGLTSEESFLIATRRVGSAAKLEPEFAKVNRSPWNKIVHGLVLVFFSVSCWLLWVMLLLLRVMPNGRIGRPFPGFTQLVLQGGHYFAVPPLLALAYCAWVWTRKSPKEKSWVGFFAVSLVLLVLMALPVIVAIFLPVIDFMNQLPRALIPNQ